MADAPYDVKGGMHEAIMRLETQRLKGIFVDYRYAVQNCEAFNGLNATWGGLPPVVYIPAKGATRAPC
jgi:hypothetical protein